MDKLVEEINSFFPELSEKININECVKYPSSTTVRDFYCRALIELGVDVDNVRKIQIAQLDADGVDIIPELNLVTAIRLTFPFLKFQLDDLLSPEPKRNAQLMSHVMNFLNFSELRLAHNNGQVEDFKRKKHRETETVKELAEMKDREATKLAALAKQLDSEEQTLKQLKEVIPKLEGEVEKLKEVIHQKRKEYMELEELHNTKENRVQSLMKQIEMVSSECEEFRKLIVQNPDEEKKNYDAKRKERDHVMQTKNEYQEKYKDHSAQLQSIQKQCEELRKKTDPILASLHVLKECSDLKKSLMKMQEEKEQLEKQKEALYANSSNLDKKIENENETFAKKSAALKSEESMLIEKITEKEVLYKIKSKELKLAEKKYKQDMETVDARISSIEKEYADLLYIYKLFMEEFNVKKKYLSNGF